MSPGEKFVAMARVCYRYSQKRENDEPMTEAERLHYAVAVGFGLKHLLEEIGEEGDDFTSMEEWLDDVSLMHHEIDVAEREAKTAPAA